MGLQGLALTSWTGWLSGFIFLKHPWGRPSFTSWISISLLIALINSVGRVFMIIDGFVHFQVEYFKPLLTGQGHLLTLVNRCAFLETAVSCLLTQLIFLIQAKKFGKLWGELHQRNLEDAKKTKLMSFGLVFQSIIALISLISMLTTGILHAIPAGRNFHKSWFSFLGHVPYSILATFFLIGPEILPSHFGLTAVLTTLFHLEFVYEKYCRAIHGMMLRLLFENVEMRESQNRKRKAANPDVMMVWTNVGKEEKVRLVHQFEEIQGLFVLSEKTISPIVLVTLTGASFRLVIYTTKLFLRQRKNAEDVDTPFVVDCCQLIHLACQLYILQVGQRIRDKFAEWKEKLRKLSMQLSSDTTEAKDLKDLFYMISNWKWQLTACDFFDVDRQLASGVFSLFMTYIVVMVQVRIAMDGTLFV